jgi:hypothetical protein
MLHVFSYSLTRGDQGQRSRMGSCRWTCVEFLQVFMHGSRCISVQAGLNRRRFVMRPRGLRPCVSCGLERRLIGRELAPKNYEIQSLECPRCKTIARLVQERRTRVKRKGPGNCPNFLPRLLSCLVRNGPSFANWKNDSGATDEPS